MIIRRVFVVLLCVCLNHLLFAQQKTINRIDDVVYDIENKPVCKVIGDNSENWYWYAPVNGKASDKIEFEGGGEAFKQLTDSLHASRWHEYNYDEINSWVLYVILFDSSLKIKSVRVLQKPYTNCKYDFTQLLKWIMYSTEGRWKKVDEADASKYFFYTRRYHFW